MMIPAVMQLLVAAAVPCFGQHPLVCAESSIKNDGMFATNWAISGWRLIDGVKRAIDKAGHPTAYILSPGNDATLVQGENVSRVADAFRITPDWFVSHLISAYVTLALHQITP